MRSRLLCCFHTDGRQVQFTLHLGWKLVTSSDFTSALWLCEMIKGIYSVALLYLFSEKLKIVGGCPSRAKDEAEVSFLVTEK